MRLYNITFRLYDTRTHLRPYVPYTAAPDEDQITERICFADSIEHCLSAIGPCERDLHNGCRILVRSIERCSLNPEKLKTPEELFETGKVPDALENREYWYLDETDVQTERYRVESFHFAYMIAFSCIKEQDMIRLIRKYISDVLMGETVKDWYEETVQRLILDHRYNDLEQLEDKIFELPWSRKVEISNLILTKECGYPCISDKTYFMEKEKERWKHS